MKKAIPFLHFFRPNDIFPDCSRNVLTTALKAVICGQRSETILKVYLGTNQPCVKCTMMAL